MNKSQIKKCIEELNEELLAVGVKGEICLYGGAVMCLVYDARPATRDVDAVFKPTREIREAIKRIAEANGLREDWLNDAVRGEPTLIAGELQEAASLRTVYAIQAEWNHLSQAILNVAHRRGSYDSLSLLRFRSEIQREYFGILERSP
jgi:hypothetical protein